MNYIVIYLKISSVEQYAVRAFADALEAIPTALAENSGLSPIETVADAKARQISEGNPRIGVDCLNEVKIIFFLNFFNF